MSVLLGLGIPPNCGGGRHPKSSPTTATAMANSESKMTNGHVHFGGVFMPTKVGVGIMPRIP